MLTIKSNTEDELKRIADALEGMSGSGTTNGGSGTLVEYKQVSSTEFRLLMPAGELLEACKNGPVAVVFYDKYDEDHPETFTANVGNLISFSYQYEDEEGYTGYVYSFTFNQNGSQRTCYTTSADAYPAFIQNVN